MNRHSTTAAPPPSLSWLGATGIAALVVAAGAHAAELMSLGPWAQNWPRAGAWPTGFHLWLTETVCVILGLLALALHRSRHRWRPWLARRSGAERARLLVAGLVMAQLLMVLGFWLTRRYGYEELGGLRAVFWLGGEFRLHALFCVAQAWLAAWLAWQVYRQEGARVWAAAAVVCAYVGLDELLSLHEAVGRALRGSEWIQFNTLNTLHLGAGVHVYAWQLIFLPLAAVVGLLLLRGFLREVDAQTLALLVVASLMFVGGAVGFEAVQATGVTHSDTWWTSDAGRLNLLLEEALETAGMTLAVYVFAARAWGRQAAAAESA